MSYGRDRRPVETDLNKILGRAADVENKDRGHWYVVDVNHAGETVMSRKFQAANSGDAAAKGREEFETSKPVMELPESYEIVVSRRFVVTNKRVRRDLEMRDKT